MEESPLIGPEASLAAPSLAVQPPIFGLQHAAVTSPALREAVGAAHTPGRKLLAADHSVEELHGLLGSGLARPLRLVSLDVICPKGKGGAEVPWILVQGSAEVKNRLYAEVKGTRGIRVKAATLANYVKQRYHADMARPPEPGTKWTSLTEAMQAMPTGRPIASASAQASSSSTSAQVIPAASTSKSRKREISVETCLKVISEKAVKQLKPAPSTDNSLIGATAAVAARCGPAQLDRKIAGLYKSIATTQSKLDDAQAELQVYLDEKASRI